MIYNMQMFHLMNISEKVQKREDQSKISTCFTFSLQGFIETLVTKIVCGTDSGIQALPNLMAFRNMSVVFGVAVVISLSLNGKW